MNSLSIVVVLPAPQTFVTGDSFPGSEWQLTVHTPWPGAEISTRPYPVTLVNWDTVMRVMGLGTSSRSGGLNYIPGVEEVQMRLPEGIGGMLLYVLRSDL